MHPAGGLYYQGDSVALPPIRTMSGSFDGTQGSNLQHFLPTHSLAQRSQFSAPESAGTTSSSYSLPQTNLISDKHKVLIFYFLYAVYSLFQREQQHLYPPLNLAGPTFRLRVELLLKLILILNLHGLYLLVGARQYASRYLYFTDAFLIM